MKIPVFGFLLLISIFPLHAQKTFEGTITYTYAVEGDNAEMMVAFMPDKMVMTYGKKGMITSIEGGMLGNMMGKVVVDAVNNEAFVVKEAEKAVYLMKPEDMEEVEEPQIKELVKQPEEEEILGYHCQRYKMVTEANGQETIQYAWVTKELKAPELKLPGLGSMAGGVLSGQKLPGFPMRIEVAIANMNANMIMTASEIDSQQVDDKAFLRPRDFTVKDFSELLGSGNR